MTEEARPPTRDEIARLLFDAGVPNDLWNNIHQEWDLLGEAWHDALRNLAGRVLAEFSIVARGDTPPAPTESVVVNWLLDYGLFGDGGGDKSEVRFAARDLLSRLPRGVAPDPQTAALSKADLLSIQAGLLAMHNEAAGLRGGWVTGTSMSEERMSAFKEADALLRSALTAAPAAPDPQTAVGVLCAAGHRCCDDEAPHNHLWPIDGCPACDEISRLEHVISLAIGRIERHEPGAALTGLRAGLEARAAVADRPPTP